MRATGPSHNALDLNPTGTIMSALGKVTIYEMMLIGIVIEGFFYGLYSALIYMHIQFQSSKGPGINNKSVVIYALGILYILSTAIIVLDITSAVVEATPTPNDPKESLLFRVEALNYTRNTIIGLCDFISQEILIYRCWVIWSHNIRVIIIPSILALAYLAAWLARNGVIYFAPVDGHLSLQSTLREHIIFLSSLGISLTVNAVVTGLIVFKILKVYRSVRPTPVKDQTLDVAGAGAKLRSIMFIIIESGVAMFIIQFIPVILTILKMDAMYLIFDINQQFLGITPTIILLRVAMGLSFYDQKSVEETVGSLRFASQNRDTVSETWDIADFSDQERIDPISIQRGDCDDIQAVDR